MVSIRAVLLPDATILSTAASDLARSGWSITGTIARLDGRWRLVEIGNVYT